MPPLPENDIDEERKKELIMEKKLRACRVNIIQRVRAFIWNVNLILWVLTCLDDWLFWLCSSASKATRQEEAARPRAVSVLRREGHQPDRPALLEPVSRCRQEGLRPRPPPALQPRPCHNRQAALGQLRGRPQHPRYPGAEGQGKDPGPCQGPWHHQEGPVRVSPQVLQPRWASAQSRDRQGSQHCGDGDQKGQREGGGAGQH